MQIARYKLSLEEFERMVDHQHGVCAVCQSPPRDGRKRLCIDHDHQTGEVRALLCSDCNSALGFMREDGAAISRLALYIDGFRKRPRRTQLVVSHTRQGVPIAKPVPLLRAKYTAYGVPRGEGRDGLREKERQIRPTTCSADFCDRFSSDGSVR